MGAEIERERTAFFSIDMKGASDVPRFTSAVKSVLEKGNERVSDVQLMLQLFYCRHVDNFQIFLEDILRSVYRGQPNILKRSESITVAQVLSHGTMEAFIEELIEARLHKLAYKSLRDLTTSVKDEMKFDLFTDAKTTRTVELIFDVRNLVTHNYGIVNKIFLSKHPDVALSIGQAYPVWPEQIAEELKLLGETAAGIEKRATQKFKLSWSGA